MMKSCRCAIFAAITAIIIAPAWGDNAPQMRDIVSHIDELRQLRLEERQQLLVDTIEVAAQLLKSPKADPGLDALPEPLRRNNFIKVRYARMETPLTKDQGRSLLLGNRNSPSVATWVATHGDRGARSELQVGQGALLRERHWVPARYVIVGESLLRRNHISAVSNSAQILEVLLPGDPGVEHVLNVLLESESPLIDVNGIPTKLERVLAHLGGKEWPTPQRLAHFHAAGLYQAGLLDEALSIYEHLHQEIDVLPSSYVALSRIYEQLGRADEATMLLVSGHEIYPHDSLILTELAMYDIRTQAYKKARERIDLVLTRSPEFPHALLLSARLHIHERELVTAMHEIIDALVYLQGWQVDVDRLLNPVFTDLYIALSNEE